MEGEESRELTSHVAPYDLVLFSGEITIWVFLFIVYSKIEPSLANIGHDIPQDRFSLLFL